LLKQDDRDGPAYVAVVAGGINAITGNEAIAAGQDKTAH
jgi:hypothetical protein